ncbi:TonB-dependent receptor plug domain-containing protein [Pseudoxanthomonas winnipegensis]|uniref:TonB-dependent receptor plug domain-containing protein n=1 Tax=Pseudoxanthomonas winnipegensis TaxID=2480810 RepID=UPI003F861FBA
MTTRRLRSHSSPRPLRRAPLTRLILVALAVAATAPAQAQETSESNAAKTLDNVIVTGTRRVGMSVDDSPAPVQVVTAEALEQSGAPDLMNQLAFQVPSFNASQQGTDMTSATLVANMRALSPNHTLILINGKRRHFTSNVAVTGGYAGAASTDLSFIPTSAIASAEVLTDGAAALYGSDAIAGVINLITRKNASGGSVSAGTSGYDDGGGFTTNYQGDFGIGDDTTYFNLALESERRQTINRPGAPYGAAACVADRLANPTRGCPATGTATTPSGYPSSTGNAALGRENEYNMIYNPWFPNNSHQGDSPAIQRDVGFLSAGMFLDDGTELYGTGSFGKKKTQSWQSYRRPSQDGGVDRNGDGDRTDPIGGTGPRSGRPLTEADINKYPYGFSPSIDTDEKDWEVGVGITGELAGWRYDLSTNYGKNQMEIDVTKSMNFTLWNRTGASPESFYVGRFSATQWDTALDLSRDFDWGLAAPTTIAAGLEYREDTYGIDPGDAASYTGAGSASFPGYNPAATGSWERNNKAAFVNVILNPTEHWIVDAAARYERYSDFGSKAVGKLTTRYDFNERFAVRGTYSTGFRAPTMGESYYTAIQVGPTAATATLQAANVGSGLKPETSRNFSVGLVFKPLDNLTTTLDAYQIRINDRIRLGSTLLYSTSQSVDTLCGRTAGCVPNPNLPDPADTNRDGRPDDAYNQTLGAALVAGGFISNGSDPTAPGGSMDATARANIGLNFFTNAMDTKTTGVDWVTTYNTAFDWAAIDWTLAANYNKTEVTRVGNAPADLGGRALLTDADVATIQYNSPKYRVNLGANIRFGERLALNIRENVYGPQYTLGTTSAYAAFPQIMNTLDLTTINGVTYYKAKIGTLYTTNIELAYTLDERLRFSIGADNLFDAYPDKTPAAIRQYNIERYATTGARDYLLGSPLGFFGTRWFAKVSYTW